MNNFKIAVLNLRKSLGMSQPEFAELVSRVIGREVTRSAVSMWELGKRIPRAEDIVKIAEYFHLNVNALLNDANNSGAQMDDEPAPEITLIARAGQKMSKEQRELMLKWAMLTFPEAFKDENKE